MHACVLNQESYILAMTPLANPGMAATNLTSLLTKYSSQTVVSFTLPQYLQTQCSSNYSDAKYQYK